MNLKNLPTRFFIEMFVKAVVKIKTNFKKDMAAYFLLFTFSFFLQAESVEGFPAKAIFHQVLNFSLFFIALIVFLKKPVREFLKKQRDDFFIFEDRAKQQQEKTQKEFSKWQQKVKELTTKQQNIKNSATKEGENFIQQKKQEIEDLKLKMAREQKFYLQLESQKIKRQSLQKFKNEVSKQAEQILEQEGKNEALQKKLYKEFSTQIEQTKQAGQQTQEAGSQ